MCAFVQTVAQRDRQRDGPLTISRIIRIIMLKCDN